MEARLTFPVSFTHPAFDAVRGALTELQRPGRTALDALNALAEVRCVHTAGGRPLRFVPAVGDQTPYELTIHDTGCVPTRPGSGHDFFNAVVWLAFPAAKARMNEIHVDRLRAAPAATGTRGPLRDLLTIFDEGGAIVVCPSEDLRRLLLEHRWKELFFHRCDATRRHMKILVFGHAVLERAAAPWPGLACKAVVFDRHENLDAALSRWFANLDETSSPALLAPVPVFGYPGWLEASTSESFYDDLRYFRPLRRDKTPSDQVTPA